jgi:phosphatidate phosphatase APP1
VFFYELHEGDDEVYSDVLVVSESEWEPQEFFDLVQRIRNDVQHGYEQDSLIEAIAAVLERDYGFIHVSDDRLVASVNVSTDDEQNFLAELEVDIADAEEDEDDDDDDPEQDLDEGKAYSTVIAEFDPDGSRLN